MSQAFGRAYSSAAPGETGYASLRGKQLDFLNAEDFRCHAIRGRAIQTFSLTHSAVATSSAFTRAQSDITDIRRHHDEMRSLSPERADDPCASLETVLEPVFEADEPIARPYLAWACSQLGVPDKYDEFDRRVRSRAHSSSESCADEEEEEYSLDQMVLDVEMTRTPSQDTHSTDSSPCSPSRPGI